MDVIIKPNYLWHCLLLCCYKNKRGWLKISCVTYCRLVVHVHVHVNIHILPVIANWNCTHCGHNKNLNLRENTSIFFMYI